MKHQLHNRIFRRSINDVCYVALVMFISAILIGCHTSKKATLHTSNYKKTEYRYSKVESSKYDFSHVHGERRRILEAAMEWMGTPYKYATSDNGVSTDCSGMVLRVYEEVTGIKLPRNSAKQYEFCKKVTPKHVKPGDLVFFATGHDPDKISHVGIMLDEDAFIHASSSKGVVISSISTPYYQRTFKGFASAF